jgi:hypothetical protein
MRTLSIQEITNLLARILKSWHIRMQRESERHPTSGEVSIWTGLHNIYNYLTQDESPAREAEETHSDEITMTHVKSVQPQTHDPQKPQLIARRFNQSRSGVALHLPLSPNNPSMVGEVVLISLQSGAQMKEWKIGITKRALNRQSGTLEIGVQFVQGRLVPVTLQATLRHPDRDEAEEPPAYPGIYIDQGQTHRSSLLVPKHFFILGQEYRVEEMIPSQAITPLQLLESTAHFERYRVKPV